MQVINTCKECVANNLDADLIPIIDAMYEADFTVIEVDRFFIRDESYTAFLLLKEELEYIKSQSMEYSHESEEFFNLECTLIPGPTYPCDCGAEHETVRVLFRTISTKEFVRAAAIEIFAEWFEEFFPSFYKKIGQ